MREIKFRAWDRRRQEMVGPPFSIGIGVISESQIYDVMQYTGLKDKNGKEIYEGDIDSKGRTIEYLTNMSGFYLMKNGGGWHLSHNQNVLNGCIKHIETIGNIYENPELLKSKKEET